MKTKNYFFICMMIIYFCMIYCTVMTYSYYYALEKSRCYNEIVEQKDIEMNQIIEEKNQLLVIYYELEEEKKSQQLKNDYLLKRDIINYIRTYYPRVSKDNRERIAETVTKKCRKYKVSPELIMGIIEVESSFNHMAISSANAKGLMQIMPMWERHFKVNNIYKIETNIETGIRVFLVHLQENKYSISRALYYYVGRDSRYSDMVYKSTGNFVAFRLKSKIKEEMNIAEQAAGRGFAGNPH